MALKAKIKLSLLMVTTASVVGILVVSGLMKIANIPSITSLHEDIFKQPFGSFQTIYHMRDFIVEYYEKSELTCFIKGSIASLSPTCACLQGWHGPRCDIPSEIFRSVMRLNRTMERRQRPRRLIFVLPINETVHLTLKTMRYLHDIVDVFVYGSLFDANSTQNQLFQAQCNPEFTHQMLFLWNLGDTGPSNSALSNPFRDLIFRAFFHLSEVRMDDLVVFSRRRQTASRNTLLFLKLHDNYPEQIILNYPKVLQSPYSVSVDVCTVASLIRCCHFDIFKLQTTEPINRSRNLSERWVMVQS